MAGELCSECRGRKTVVARIRVSEKSDDTLNVEVDCPICKGTGEVKNPEACTNCHGSKTMIANFGGLKVQVACDTCNGTGRRQTQEMGAEA